MKVVYLDVQNKSLHDIWKIAKSILKEKKDIVLLVPQFIIDPFKEYLKPEEIKAWNDTIKKLASDSISV